MTMGNSNDENEEIRLTENITADGKELFAGSSTRKTPSTPKWQEMMTSMAMIRNNSNDKLRGRRPVYQYAHHKYCHLSSLFPKFDSPLCI